MKFCLLLATLLLLAAHVEASEAAFSTDGKYLWTSSKDGGGLVRMTAQGAEKQKVFPLPAELKGADSVHIVSTKSGLLLSTDTHLWKWDPEKSGRAELRAELPPSFFVFGMNAVPPGAELPAETILISGIHLPNESKPLPKDFDTSRTLYACLPGEKAFKSIFVRRLNGITACPVYGEGRMIFGGDHDLWVGGISQEEGDRVGVLWGHRIAPLALANTDMANSGSMGVVGAAVAGGQVWTALGGRHMGALVSLPLVDVKPTEEHPDLADAWAQQATNLSKARIWGVEAEGSESAVVESVTHLCAWQGSDQNWKVAYRANHGSFWIITSLREKAVPLDEPQ